MTIKARVYQAGGATFFPVRGCARVFSFGFDVADFQFQPAADRYQFPKLDPAGDPPGGYELQGARRDRYQGGRTTLRLELLKFWSCRIEIVGQTSAGFPKQTVPDRDSGRVAKRKSVSVLGLRLIGFGVPEILIRTNARSTIFLATNCLIRWAIFLPAKARRSVRPSRRREAHGQRL